MGDADYSGVATWELAQLIKDCNVENHQVLAMQAGLDSRWVYRVIYNEVPWINLSIADKICMAMGRNISKDLTVIPAGYNNSSKRMAKDEFWAKEIEPTPEQVTKRAQEYNWLRYIMLEVAAYA